MSTPNVAEKNLKAKRLDLSWIVVADVKKAIEYYTQVLGLELVSEHAEFGWAEVVGPEGGSRLGLAESRGSEMPPGINATFTFLVEDIEEAKKELGDQVSFQGDVMEVPEQVKLQSCTDPDGNHFQLVEHIGYQ